MKQYKLKQHINRYFSSLKGLPPILRKTLGTILIILGFFGFLPVIGFWMIPLGLMLLAIDFRWAKRLLTRIKYKYRQLRKQYNSKHTAKNTKNSVRD